MAKEIVQNQLITVDYRRLENSIFEDCKFVYKGGQGPEIIDCEFKNCSWVFDGSARNTLEFMKSMGSSEGGKNLVLKNFLGFDV